MTSLSLDIGPSHISASVREDLVALAASDLLSASHRGPAVKTELRAATRALRTAMHLPADYGICFQPSATAAMELVLRNLVAEQSFHFVQGAFAERFAATGELLGRRVRRAQFPWEAPCRPQEVRIPEATELIAVTHNETSTGRMWPAGEMAELRTRHPRALLAVDVTSSFGALRMAWAQADLWFGSVQKCLGLPAGLGFVLASPRALERARALGSQRRVAAWQDMPALVELLEDGQTPETPNVLGIALLRRQMERWDLDRIERETHAKAAAVAAAFGEQAFFVRHAPWRSLTTHCLVVDDPAAWKRRAERAGYVLGCGYGALKARCIRLAGFPSVPRTSLEEALRTLAPRRA